MTPRTFLRQTTSRLSAAARVWLAALPSAHRELIRADVAHLERHPDPAGDLSGLRMSLRMSLRRVA